MTSAKTGKSEKVSRACRLAFQTSQGDFKLSRIRSQRQAPAYRYTKTLCATSESIWNQIPGPLKPRRIQYSFLHKNYEIAWDFQCTLWDIVTWDEKIRSINIIAQETRNLLRQKEKLCFPWWGTGARHCKELATPVAEARWWHPCLYDYGTWIL